MKRPWFIVGGITIFLTIVLEIIYRHHGHPYFWWHATPAFDFIYGLAGCVVIVLVSKWLGHAWLQRDESYYGDDLS